MPKICLATAIALYEEDCNTRIALYEEDCKTQIVLSAPKQDPHWDDWYEYGLSIEDEVIEKYDDNAENTHSATHTKDYTSELKRRKRRISNAKAKKKLTKNAEIASANYAKRAEDIMYYTSKVKEEIKVFKHSHPLTRAERLIKKARKIS